MVGVNVQAKNTVKEAKEVKESCFCGRTGEVQDRLPVLDADDKWALRCPDCGHRDRMDWLFGEARTRIFEKAESPIPNATSSVFHLRG